MRSLSVLLIIFIILFSFAAGDDGPGMLLFYLSLKLYKYIVDYIHDSVFICCRRWWTRYVNVLSVIEAVQLYYVYNNYTSKYHWILYKLPGKFKFNIYILAAITFSFIARFNFFLIIVVIHFVCLFPRDNGEIVGPLFVPIVFLVFTCCIIGCCVCLSCYDTGCRDCNWIKARSLLNC